MSQSEGVVRFQLQLTQTPPIPCDHLREVNAWRKILYLAQLIGQDPGRYYGFGYGNISQRLGPFGAPERQRRFVISGTQTGHLADLTGEHYATVGPAVSSGGVEKSRGVGRREGRGGTGGGLL